MPSLACWMARVVHVGLSQRTSAPSTESGLLGWCLSRRFSEVKKPLGFLAPWMLGLAVDTVMGRCDAQDGRAEASCAGAANRAAERPGSPDRAAQKPARETRSRPRRCYRW